MISIKTYKYLLISMILLVSFKSYGMKVENIRSNDSVLIEKTKLIIDYCNDSDSLSLMKLLRIKSINNEVTDNSLFLNFVFNFNLLGKKNKILAYTFFQKSTEYCYRFFGENFVLAVGKDSQVFEFNDEGYLVGYYVCANLK